MAESREQRAESREQRIVMAIDLSVNHTSVMTIGNRIMAKENYGICNWQGVGSGVAMEIIKEFSK